MHAIRANPDGNAAWSVRSHSFLELQVQSTLTGRSDNRKQMGTPGALAKKEQAQSAQVYCETARRLLEEFGDAVSMMIYLHEQQFQAIMDADSDAARFDVLIHEANEARQNAKYAYLSHLHVHGCSIDRWKP